MEQTKELPCSCGGTSVTIEQLSYGYFFKPCQCQNAVNTLKMQENAM